MNIDELIIPIEGEIEFDELVSKFENLQEQEGGTLKENRLEQTIQYITLNHTSIVINVEQAELIITNYFRQKPIELIKYCLKDIQQLSQQPVQLLKGCR